MTELEILGKAAKESARKLAIAGEAEKNKALSIIAEEITANKDKWLQANAIDVSNAKENGMRASLLDRLTLNDSRVEGIVEGVRQVMALPDPIGKTLKADKRPNGLIIGKRTVPLGVLAIVYEARPNVTVDAAVLALKSGNACILRGGKEAINSNIAVVEIMRGALKKAGLPEDCISLVTDTTHESVNELMSLTEYVDVMIPRGGAGLIRSVCKNSKVPVIRTGEGVCHIYVEKNANLQMASDILFNAKCSRPSVCNAAECVLIDKEIAEEFLKIALNKLIEKKVECRPDKYLFDMISTQNLAPEGMVVKEASEEDWDSEYGDYILAMKSVECFDEAVDFISAHGTGHSEAIITESYSQANKFLDEVDAAAVYVNASTRFTDGGEFGLGAEIGISTQKMHARGPMGLEELTSYKYVVYGDGQIR